jgi:methyl-accepting chemotaxis protein
MKFLNNFNNKRNTNGANRRLSLSSQIVALAVGLLVLVGVLTGIQFKLVTRQLDRSNGESAKMYAELLGEAIGGDFYQRYIDIQNFAAHQSFKVGAKEDMVQALNNFVSLYPMYDAILFVGPDGKAIAVNSLSPTGQGLHDSELYSLNFAEENWFKEPINGKFLDDLEHGLSGTSVQEFSADRTTSELYGESKFAATFSTIVHDAHGSIAGVLSAHANSNWIAKEMSKLRHSLSQLGYHEVEMQIVNSNGEVMVGLHPKVGEQSAALAKDDAFEVRHTFEQLGKVYLPARESAAGKEGYAYVADPEHRDAQLAGYGQVKGNNYPSALRWGVIIRIAEREIRASVISAERRFTFTLVAIIVIGFAASLYFARRTGRAFMAVSDQLLHAVETAHGMSHDLNASSARLAASSQEQAAAIQESVSALSEMSSMIAQTGQSVKISLETARESHERATDGERIMTSMGSAMSSIQQANSQLQSISKVIEDINSKAAVINDIVFKTQLLSFNASIEAARAGQHGRGFAVVAEEVGALAEMSGQAAREIELLLEESKLKVSETLDLIQNRVDEGHRVSERATSAFNEITRKINEINTQMRSINEATHQQEIGVQQTNSAMKQLDQASIGNSHSSIEAQQSSERLRDAAEHLRRIATELRGLTAGEGAPTQHSASSSRHTTSSESTPSASSGGLDSDEALESLVKDLAASRTQGASKSADPMLNVSADDHEFKKVI